MAIEPTSTDAQAANVDQAPAATSSNAQAATDSESITLDDARKLRSEANNLRKRLKAFEEAEQAANAAKMSETERLNQQYADLQAQHETLAAELAEARVHQAVARHANDLNFAISADLITRLLDWDEIEFDAGKPTNIERLLKDLAKSQPSLLRGERVQTSGGATNPSRTATSGQGALSWDVITKMTPEQYNARRAEIQHWMARNPMKMI